MLAGTMVANAETEIQSIGNFKETIMGKYFIAWLLGVPLFVLVLIYLIF